MGGKKNQKTIWNKKKPKAFSYSSFIGLFILIAALSDLVYALGSGYTRSRRLESSGIITQAVVINEKNYWGNSPVSHTFSYSYSFEVDGKKYVGDTRDTKCRLGEIVRIKYVSDHPSFNAMVEKQPKY